jgi:hypothetical protein
MGGRAEKRKSCVERMEAARIRRIREDAKRPISVNLEEAIALSHMLLKMRGAAKRAEEAADK